MSSAKERLGRALLSYCARKGRRGSAASWRPTMTADATSATTAQNERPQNLAIDGGEPSPESLDGLGPDVLPGSTARLRHVETVIGALQEVERGPGHGGGSLAKLLRAAEGIPRAGAEERWDGNAVQ